MTISTEKSIPRKALELIVEKALPDDMLPREANALRRAASVARGVTVNSFSGRYTCPLEQVFGHQAAVRLCNTPIGETNPYLNFQSEFDWLMDEYFERSIFEHACGAYEVFIDG